MASTRIIYNALGLYASQVAATGVQTGNGAVKQLTRVQSFNEDFTRNLTDINQYGNLAAIDRLDIEPPTVNASFSYYVTDGGNENNIGFTVRTASPLVSCVSGILSKETDSKNYYLLVVDEGNGQDASNYTGPSSGVIAIGNATITSYSLNVAVGEVPTADVSVEGLNWRTYADFDGTNDVPAVNPVNGLPVTGVPFVLPQHQTNAYGAQPSALLPGDVTLDIAGALGFTTSQLNVQSATVSFDLSRTPINRLGSRYAFSREIDFPVTATMEVNGQFVGITDSNLANLLCDTGVYDLTMLMRRNSCSGNGAGALAVQFRGAKLSSQSLETTLGDNASVTLTYEIQIGGPNDLGRGLFFSGSYQ